MITIEEAEKAAGSLLSFQGADFTDKKVQEQFKRSLDIILEDFRREGLHIVQDKAVLGNNQVLLFEGVTFDPFDDSGIPFMNYTLARRK